MKTKKWEFAIILFLSLTFMASISQSRIAYAGSREISVPQDFQTVQAAIDNASDGDIVAVKSGTYREQLMINKTISIVGESDTNVTIESDVDNDTITVVADHVSISGLTITNKGPSTRSYGVRLCNVSYCVIADNTFMKNFVGVMVEGGSDNTIRNNVIMNNRYGVFTRHYVNLFPSSNNTICNNYVANSSWNGIELDWGGNNTVSANFVVDSIGYGFEIPVYAPSYGNVIFHNSFVDNAKAWDLTTQAYGPQPNYWDMDGEGNFWSDYAGLDLYSGPYQNVTGSDGIFDAPYVTMENTVDHYPLRGAYCEFEIDGYPFGVVSNSTPTSLSFVEHDSEGTLRLNVSDASSGNGFCRITFPRIFVADPYEVWLDGRSIGYPQATVISCSDESRGCLYLNFGVGAHIIEIKGITHVFEYSFPSILLVLSAFGGLVVYVLRKIRITRL